MITLAVRPASSVCRVQKLPSTTSDTIPPTNARSATMASKRVRRRNASTDCERRGPPSWRLMSRPGYVRPRFDPVGSSPAASTIPWVETTAEILCLQVASRDARVRWREGARPQARTSIRARLRDRARPHRSPVWTRRGWRTLPHRGGDRPSSCPAGSRGTSPSPRSRWDHDRARRSDGAGRRASAPRRPVRRRCCTRPAYWATIRRVLRSPEPPIMIRGRGLLTGIGLHSVSSS